MPGPSSTQDCLRCGRNVIVRDDGKALEPEPHRLGIHNPAGGQLTPSEIAKAFHGSDDDLVGHLAHICDPNEQAALFELVGVPARKARSRR
jgi:hypothetical protein